MNGHFFYVCGYTLQRLGRHVEADKVFEEAAQADLFPSFWQRSTHYVKGLTSKPVWNLKDTGISYLLKTIRREWKKIRDEALSIYNMGLYTESLENLRDTGKWSMYGLYSLGKRVDRHCLLAPYTCSLIHQIPHLANNRRGDVKFSMMLAGTKVVGHSGPTNSRLRIHLGLSVPQNDTGIDELPLSRIRVHNEHLTWRNGEIIIFDDSFDHEVWHFNALNHSRLILIMDMWHPDMTEYQIAIN